MKTETKIATHSSIREHIPNVAVAMLVMLDRAGSAWSKYKSYDDTIQLLLRNGLASEGIKDGGFEYQITDEGRREYIYRHGSNDGPVKSYSTTAEYAAAVQKATRG